MIDGRWFFKDKKVTVMGLGLLGRGVGDVAYIAESGAEDVLVTDMKTREQLAESVAALQKYPQVRFSLGGHREADFVDRDMIIKAAGVPKRSPFLEVAESEGTPVHMSTALAADWCMQSGVRVIGITGTRGKSTVTHLIYDVLKKSAEQGYLKGNVHVGGNVRGVSTLQLLDGIEPEDTLVLELDSWQLQGFGERTISPQISVFTNLMPDHLNYYANMDEYFLDKAQIFLWQKEGDVLICGGSVRERIEGLYPPTEPRVPVIKKRRLKLVGEHNQENAALAAEVLVHCGLTSDVVERELSLCEPVEGRLQLVRTIHTEGNVVEIYNDNNATTPEATIRALESFSDPTVLICGGSNKELPFTELVERIVQKNVQIVLLPGSGSDVLAKELAARHVAYTLADTMHDAVREAIHMSTEKTGSVVILLSPACASFGLFKNEYDRNDQFLEAVSAL